MTADFDTLKSKEKTKVKEESNLKNPNSIQNKLSKKNTKVYYEQTDAAKHPGSPGLNGKKMRNSQVSFDDAQQPKKKTTDILKREKTKFFQRKDSVRTDQEQLPVVDAMSSDKSIESDRKKKKQIKSPQGRKDGMRSEI